MENNIEAWGTGIPRLYNRSAEYELPEPLFEEFGDGIKVTMFRKVSNALEEDAPFSQANVMGFKKHFVHRLELTGLNRNHIMK